MTISSAQFRHDDVFLQEHFAPPPRRSVGTHVAACAGPTLTKADTNWNEALGQFRKLTQYLELT
jgi:hypothetical protein